MKKKEVLNIIKNRNKTEDILYVHKRDKNYDESKEFHWDCRTEGDNIKTLKQGLKKINGNALLSVRTYNPEQSKLNRIKQAQEKKEQIEMEKRFKKTFGYTSVSKNGLTTNRFSYLIDTKNMIQSRSWNGVKPTYNKIDNQELKEHQDNYSKISV